ncbi:MAG: hypothetical protein IS632_01610 [Thaumarchaeota archaeon]|nr:hypothetical protein [Nitrososphaerota archaeon]
MIKNKKAGKKHNPNRTRSKNNPGGRRNDPKTAGPSTTGAAAPRAKGMSGGCAG